MRSIFYTLLSLTLAFSAHAATLSVSPHEIPLGATSTVAISIDTEGATINALEMTLSFPTGDAHIEGVFEGTSFVSFWTGAPTITNNIVTLSGIIPGGFRGKGTVTTLLVSGVREGATQLHIGDVSVLLNDGKGTSAPTKIGDMSITVSESASSVSATEDTTSPEPFTVSVLSDPSIADGAYVAVFATQDKQTGISKYEIQETHSFSPNEDAWIAATSPYVLSDQTLKSRIFVRATDYEGNNRIEQFKSKEGISVLEGALYLMLSLVAVLLLFAFYVRHMHRKKIGLSH